jgi:hypothetical protein
MAYEGAQPIKPSVKAGGDLRTKQFYFVKLSADDTVVICAAATDKPIGVLQNAPNTGEAAEVCTIGISKVSSDAALSAGDLIGTAADGQADAKTPGTDTTEYTCGTVLTGSAAAAGLATAVINCASPGRAA